MRNHDALILSRLLTELLRLERQRRGLDRVGSVKADTKSLRPRDLHTREGGGAEHPPPNEVTEHDS